MDDYVRLEIAGIEKEKMVCKRDELSAVDGLKLDGIQTVFILHDLYSMELKEAVKKKVEVMITNRDTEQEEEVEK